MSVAVYKGPFGREQAERLLWRAGFGPRKGEAAALAKLGLDGAVRSLTHPRGEKFVGPAPRDDKGRALAPADAWGHDHLWWLDRMVRTSRPLVERMTLVWHDWFATSLDGVGSQKLMLKQNRLLRRLSLGSFDKLLLEITKDPAMLLWLSGTQNTKWSPNENYARELMELFTLGAGSGYTERDVREQARALTGFENDWKRGAGPYNFRFEGDRHDAGQKRIFGKTGAFDWQDAVRLCLHHKRHPSFFVDKLWRYFIPTTPDAGTRRSLESLYRKDFQILPRRRGDPPPPGALHGPAHGQAACRLHRRPAARARSRRRHAGLAWLSSESGQRLFMPPNVSGWDDERWLDTATFRGRWEVANYATQPYSLTDKQSAALPAEPKALVDGRARLLGLPDDPARDARGARRASPRRRWGTPTRSWKKTSYRFLVANALRQLIAVSPDLQTS